MWLFVITALMSLVGLEARPFLDCRVDVVFALDGSASVGVTNWEATLDFVRDFVYLTAFGPDKTRCGVVSFGDTATLDIKLHDYWTVDGFTKALQSIKYKDEATNTAAGLRLARKHLLNSAQGARPDASKMLILITDGQPTVDTLQTYPEIIHTRRAGVTILPVGIGRDIGRDILLKFVDGDANIVFTSDDLEELVESMSDVLGPLCLMTTSTQVPSGKPGPGGSATPTPVPSGGVTPTPVPSGVTPTPAPAGGTTPTPAPAGGTTPTPAPSGGATPTPAPTGGATPTPAPTGSATPTPAPTGSATPTPAPTGGATPTPAPTGGATPIPAPTGGATSTPAPTSSTTPSPAPGGGYRPELGGSGTPTSTPEGGSTLTLVPGGSDTAPPIPTDSGTPTPVSEGSGAPTVAPGASGTYTPPTGGSRTPSPAPAGSGTPTPSPGGSGTPTPTSRGSSTPSPAPGERTPTPAIRGSTTQTPIPIHGSKRPPSSGGGGTPAPGDPATTPARAGGGTDPTGGSTPDVPGGATPGPAGGATSGPAGDFTSVLVGGATRPPAGGTTPAPAGETPVSATGTTSGPRERNISGPASVVTSGPAAGATSSATPAPVDGATPAPMDGSTPAPVGGVTPIPAGSAIPAHPLPCDRTDLVMLLDSSGSLEHKDNWERIKEVATLIVKSVMLGAKNTQIGIVIFSSEAFLTVQLGAITDRRQLPAVIDTVPWISQMTNISGALRMARTRMFNTNNDRKDAPNVVLLVTDGLSNRAITTTMTEATKLKNAGVRIFVVGIGEKVDLRELRGISSTPIRHYLTLVPAVEELSNHAKPIFHRTCVDAAPLIPSNQPVRGACPFDIVVVVHDTDGSPESFKLIVNLVRRLSNLVDLSTAHRIGMFQQSSRKEIIFYPMEYIRKDDFLNHLDSLTPIGPSTNVSNVFRHGLDMLTQTEDAGIMLAQSEDAGIMLAQAEDADTPALKILMLLLPEGINKADIRKLEYDARVARAAGVIVYVVYGHMEQEELIWVADQPAQLFLHPFSKPIFTNDICLTHQAGTIGCDFETPDGLPTFCTMIQDIEDHFNWTLSTGDTPSLHTGPEAAVTGPYYAFIETSVPRRPGDIANLFLPNVTWSGLSCLSFFYHMSGWHVGMLQVVISSPDADGQIVWVLGGDQGERWLRGMVTIDITDDDEVFFRGIRGGAFSGDIALDHVRLSPSPCIVSPADFEGLVLP